MTFEELAIEFMMDRMRQDEGFYDRIINDGEDDYERWLKEQMGEEYQTLAENEESMKNANEEFIKNKLPDKIETNFEEILGKG